jgi:hypothetical protein
MDSLADAAQSKALNRAAVRFMLRTGEAGSKGRRALSTTSFRTHGNFVSILFFCSSAIAYLIGITIASPMF